MHSRMKQPVIYNGASNVLNKIGHDVTSRVRALNPKNRSDAVALFTAGYYCYFAHITEVVNPHLGCEYRNEVNYFARKILEDEYRVTRLIDSIVEPMESCEWFHEQVGEIAEDVSNLFYNAHPNVDHEDIAHIQFDIEARTLVFSI